MGGERKPTFRTRLSLESLDGRVVPSGNPTDAPSGGTVQVPAQTETALTADSSLWFYATNGSVGVLSQDADGNVWWYAGTQAGGLTSVSWLGSWEDPNSPLLGAPAAPAAIPPGAIGAIGGGMATVPQPVIQVGADGSWIIDIHIRITITPPGNKPGVVPKLPAPGQNDPPELPPIAPIPVAPPPPGAKKGDPVLPPVPTPGPVPPLPGEKK